MRLIPFEPEHIAKIRQAWNDVQAATEHLDAIDFATYRAAGPAYTGMDGDEVIGCGGIVLLWPGVGHVWMFLGDQVSRHRVSFVRACRERFEALAKELDLHRLQASVDARDERATRFAARMGFRLEGLLRQYGPDRGNHLMFALVRED